MDSIGKAVALVLETARAPSRQELSPAPSAGQPPLLDRTVDYDIPARVWSNWKPDHGPRMIVRHLTESERAALQRRSYTLECGLSSFTPVDVEFVDEAIDAMFAGFRSMRQDGEVGAAITEVTRAILRKFPAWAIVQGCLRIAQNEAGLDPRWVPNDAQIHAVVEAIVAPYRKALDSAQLLLSALVEQPGDNRPTRAEIESKLGRPVEERKAVEVVDQPPPHDDKHAERVAADIEARKARREKAA